VIGDQRRRGTLIIIYGRLPFLTWWRYSEVESFTPSVGKTQFKL